MSQDRLDEVSMIAIENKEARSLDLNDLVDIFASKKATRKDKFSA